MDQVVTYQVQELRAGKWYPVRSYDNKEDADLHASQLRKGRVVRMYT